LKYGLRAERGQTRDCGSNRRETFHHGVHPRERVYDHEIDEPTAQNVLDKSTQEVRSVELTFGRELNPRYKDIDQEQGQEKLDGIWLNAGTIFCGGRVELGNDIVEVVHTHNSSPI